MFKRGDICVSRHHYAFRSGKPYTVLTVQKDHKDRECYFIQFEDGAVDWFPVRSEEEHMMMLASDIIIERRKNNE